MNIKIEVTSGLRESSVCLYLPCEKDKQTLSPEFIESTTYVTRDSLSNTWGTYDESTNTRKHQCYVDNDDVDGYIKSIKEKLKAVKKFNLNKPETKTIYIEV